jgi:Family of unknown function (DUF6058)
MSEFTAADVDYIKANYVTLDELCANRPESPGAIQELIAARRLPCPSYVLDDGTEMFPADYFRLVDDAGGVDALPEHFAARHEDAARRQRVPVGELERDWEAYLDGTYGICLREVTPERIVGKSALVTSLCQLLMLPKPRNAEWRRELREQVDELDALEREFAPDYDRGDDQDRPPTRDLLIEAARERYPDLFAEARAAVPTEVG